MGRTLQGRRAGLISIMCAIVLLLCGLAALPATALTHGVSPAVALPAADPPTFIPNATHDRPVSAVPVPWTPQVLNGEVVDQTQVGNQMVVGGSFSTVAPSSGSPQLARSNLFAFNAINGAINTSFAPSVSGGPVYAVEPGPNAGTVFVAGAFQGINGVNDKVVLLNVSNGQVVSSFDAPAMNGRVNDITLIGNRLYVAGVFTTVGGQPHGGLVSLNATTGARENFLSVDLTENHNYTGQPGQARAPVGAWSIAVTPQGDQVAVIGNFRKADGLERRQMALIDLTGPTAVVREDWRTNRYAHSCFSNAFDTYLRDADVAPDGSYFVVATTGGPNPGSLCDTVTRWDVSDSGQDVQPTWIDDTGGDTLHSATSSGAAVYTGGHQRWHNNHGGRDRPAPGAVPRPGLAGVDVDTGMPLAWNPGRSPRGVGAKSVYVTPAGLWVGSDTEQIGHHTYRRPRLAFFPVAGGTPLGEGDTGSLPSNVYMTGNQPVGTIDDVLYRVNAGGPALPALDGGPEWIADNGTTNPYRNSGSNASPWSPGAAIDGTVPSSTPPALYDSERWDPGDNPEMAWAFPVPVGEEVVVRLYLANRCTCTSQPGQRAFDIALEGAPVLQNYDMVTDVGDQVGTMKSFTVTSDGTINLEWLHRVENPLVNGIEILEHVPGDPGPEPTGLSRVWYEGAQVVEPVQAASAGDIDWTQVRGAVVIDGNLYYGTTSSDLVKRSFNGTSYGPATLVDPYDDPYWSNINTGSGQTYRGVKPSFYNEIPTLMGMAYDDGRLYYTRAGSNRLYSRGFLPDSGVMTQAVREVPGFAPANLGGIFLDEGAENLYYANTATGALSRIGWDDGLTVGASTVVSGPSIDGVDWRGRALFLADGPGPAPNEPPSAVLGADCERLACAFDASGSADADGSILSYLWDLGDGTTSTEEAFEHVYTEGEYTVMLTVTDDRGATGTATTQLVVEANQAPTAVILDPVCDRLECAFDGSASSDPDDSIVSYVWDFGDGGPPAEDATVTRTFPGEGSYEVTLTVTDEWEATSTTTVALDVLANQVPVAVIGEPVCELLECVFDGSDSFDPDSGDSVVGYAWDFGDGSAGDSGESVSHVFAEAGVYTVTLTVTDAEGGTGSVEYEQTVLDGSEPEVTAPVLVGQNAAMVQQSAKPVLELPEEIQAGDLLVLFVTSNHDDGGAGVGPSGAGDWDQESRAVSGPLVTSVHTKVADGTEAGAQVSMTWPSNTYRTDLTVVAYRGVGADGVEVLESAVGSNTATHTTPTVSVAGDERLALSFWSDRSSSTTGWTAPAGVDVVSTLVGSGGGRVSSLLVQDTVGSGSYGGLVATTNTASARSIALTLVLAPESSDA